MLTLVFDLDDTMVPSAVRQLDCVNEVYRTGFTYTDFAEVKFSWLALLNKARGPDLPPSTQADLQLVFRKGRLLEQSAFAPDTYEVWLAQFKAWHQAGYRIVICTARGWHPEAAYLTQGLLKELNSYCEVVVVNHDDASKVAKLHATGIYPDLMVDDSPREIRAALSANIPVVMWNEHVWLRPKVLDDHAQTKRLHRASWMQVRPTWWIGEGLDLILQPMAASHKIRSGYQQALQARVNLANRVSRKILARTPPSLLQDELATLRILASPVEEL